MALANFTNCVTLGSGAPWDAGTYKPAVGTPGGWVNGDQIDKSGHRYYADPAGDFGTPLRNAYAALPGYGGEIHIWPTSGGAPWFVNSQVEFKQKPVKIIQHGGSVITHGPGLASSMFSVQCQMVYQDAYFSLDVKSTMNGSSIFLLQGVEGTASARTCSCNATGTFNGVPSATLVQTTTPPAHVNFVDFGYSIGNYLQITTTADVVIGYFLIVSVLNTNPGSVIVQDPGNLLDTFGTVKILPVHQFDDFKLQGGQIDIGLSTTGGDVSRYMVVNAQGVQTGVPTNMSGGIQIDGVTLKVRNCTKSGSPVTQQSTAGTGPYNGFGLIYARSIRSVQVTNCQIKGNSGAGVGNYAGTMIDYDSCMYSEIGGITISDVDLSAADGTFMPYIRLHNLGGAGIEGGHVILHDIFCEGGKGRNLIDSLNSPWIRIHNVDAGRMTGFVSAIKIFGGKCSYITGSGAHNCPGPDTTMAVSANGTTLTFVGGYAWASYNLKVGDWFYIGGPRLGSIQHTTPAMNKMYEVASITNSAGNAVISVSSDPPPIAGSVSCTVAMQAWTFDCENVEDLQLKNNDYTFRLGNDGPPVRTFNCAGVWREALEPANSSQKAK